MLCCCLKSSRPVSVMLCSAVFHSCSACSFRLAVYIWQLVSQWLANLVEGSCCSILYHSSCVLYVRQLKWSNTGIELHCARAVHR